MIHFKYGIHDFEFERNYYHELQYETQLLQVYDVSIINFILKIKTGYKKKYDTIHWDNNNLFPGGNTQWMRNPSIEKFFCCKKKVTD